MTTPANHIAGQAALASSRPTFDAGMPNSPAIALRDIPRPFNSSTWLRY